MAVNIQENLQAISDRIYTAARKAGRDPGDIRLVAVTKTVDLKEMRRAIKAGVRDFGENYIQESAEKIEKIRRSSVKWHFVGKLQKNKARIAVDLFDMIHTVDKLTLAQEINRRATEPIDILIQVKLADEQTKGGIDPAGAIELAREISGLANLRLKGLMTIPPATEDPEQARPYFITLRRVAERINKEQIPGVVLTELSMGMSNDFGVAIEEGATIVRIGRALFGERPVKE